LCRQLVFAETGAGAVPHPAHRSAPLPCSRESNGRFVFAAVAHGLCMLVCDDPSARPSTLQSGTDRTRLGRAE
jgi:hypothetical protein